MKKSVLLFSLVALSLGACNTDSKYQESRKARDAANRINFSENAEIQNIERRLKETASPGKIGFVLLLNEAGQPIYYTGVVGKITSGGKRLTPMMSVYDGVTQPAPSDEGTFGSSGEYIYFWTTGGQYIQWNGKYLYSDKPFRLKIEPLAVSVTTEEKPKN